MKQLIWDLIEAGSKARNGHFTLMKFTTHWKAMFGTPNLDIDGRVEVRALKPSNTPEGAILNAITDLLKEIRS